MITKTDKHQYFFEVDVSSTKGRKGLLEAKDVKGSIEISTAPEFKGGVPDIWTSEHLFLGSICSGFMAAYLGIAEKRNLKVNKLTCSAIGQINLFDNHLEFTSVNLYPRIYINDKRQIELANELLFNSIKQCIVINSLKPLLINHGEILFDKIDIK